MKTYFMYWEARDNTYQQVVTKGSSIIEDKDDLSAAQVFENEIDLINKKFGYERTILVKQFNVV